MAVPPPSSATHPLASTSTTHQQFVFTDPIAFRYLEEDPSTQVLARKEQLQGYTCYIVEQWACSRTNPTFVITTYTGDPAHTIVVNVLSVPVDEASWSPRLRVYFKALGEYHARRRETPLGILMTTNLSGFPSSLTVIPVPNGDIQQHRQDFYVNENLKRLNCSGRVGLTLSKPSPAAEAKFFQLYRTSDKIPVSIAVIELVKLCQVALILFNKLEAEYADGLLCDQTEIAINDWWLEIGTDYLNVEPHDGILGPTTVSAVLGMLIGARNRLNATGASVPKDVFDIGETKKAIAYFQRSQRIQKTRRLDRQTLSRLHSATAKAASGEGWFVPRAVKSTVAELSGKGGEMVMDMVRARSDKAGIAEVETVDMDSFIQNIQGGRLKYLWLGKQRKSTTDGKNRKASGEEGGRKLRREKNLSQQSGNDVVLLRSATFSEESLSGPILADEKEKEKEKQARRRKTNDKQPSSKIQEASRGFGRIKGAVGLRGHNSKQSRDDVESWRASIESARLPSNGSQNPPEVPTSLAESPPPPSIISPPAKSFPRHNAQFTQLTSETPTDFGPPSTSFFQAPMAQTTSSGTPSRSSTPSIAGSSYRGIDLDDLFQHNTLTSRQVLSISAEEIPLPSQLRRRCSLPTLKTFEHQSPSRLPRHLSFSLAIPALHYFHPSPAPASPNALTPLLKLLPMTNAALNALPASLSPPNAPLPSISHWRSVHAKLSREADELLANCRGELFDDISRLDADRAKLTYETNALRAKVEDLEAGVGEYAQMVRLVEDRVGELERRMGKGEVSGEEGVGGGRGGWSVLGWLLGRGGRVKNDG